MRKLTLLLIPLAIILLGPHPGDAKVMVGGKEIRSAPGSKKSGDTGSSRDIFYNPYSNVGTVQQAPQATGPSASYMTYQVRPGDTLTLIALNYMGNSNMAYALALFNGITNPNQIQVGQVIVIPRPRIGLQYRIELLRSTPGGCEIMEVSDNFPFRSGDKFRLRLRSNVNGYIYIFNVGTSQTKHMIFPDPRVFGGANHVQAYREYTVPAMGWFQFDNRPGTEKLIIVESLKPVDSFVGLLHSGDQISPGQIFAVPLNQQQWMVISTRMNKVKKSSRDIYLAYDHVPAGGSNVYLPQSGFISQTINKPGDLFMVEIFLTHK